MSDRTPYQPGERQAVADRPRVEADGFITFAPQTRHEPTPAPFAVITLERTTPVFTDGHSWVASCDDGSLTATGRTAAEALAAMATLIDADSVWPFLDSEDATGAGVLDWQAYDDIIRVIQGLDKGFQALRDGLIAASKTAASDKAGNTDQPGQVPHV